VREQIETDEPMPMRSTERSSRVIEDSGHLYLQTNETHNAIVHYRRAADGTLTEIEHVLTCPSHTTARRVWPASNKPRRLRPALQRSIH